MSVLKPEPQPSVVCDDCAASDMEILCSMFSNVLKPEASRKTAMVLLKHFGALTNIFGADDVELEGAGNLSCQALSEIRRVRALMRSIMKSRITNRPLLDNLDSVSQYARAELAGKTREEFHVMFLDTSYHLLQHECMQTGTIDHVAVYPRELIARALNFNASHLILIHNHPGGAALPSRYDIDMTQRLVEAARMLQIEILDHIIIGRDTDFSFRQNGLFKVKQPEKFRTLNTALSS